MFNYSKASPSLNLFHKIQSNKVDLYSTELGAVIQSGTNLYGNRIISVITFSDDNSSWYINAIVTESTYLDYLLRKVSFLSVLENAPFVFIVEQIDGEEDSAFSVAFADIPSHFRPLPKSFYPGVPEVVPFLYSASLKGGLADVHTANPEDAIAVTSGVTRILQSATDPIAKRLGIVRKIMLDSGTAIAASYRFDFIIDFTTSNELFQTHREEVFDYLSLTLDYIFQDLEHDGRPSVQNPAPMVEHLSHRLKDLCLMITDVAPHSYPEHSNRKDVVKSIEGALIGVRSFQFNGGYDRLVFSNRTAAGETIPFASVDTRFVNEVATRFTQEDVIAQPDVFESDVAPVPYSIEVEKLDRRNGRGEALLSVGTERTSVKFEAKGRDSYDHTVLSMSLNERKVYVVKGIATRKRGVIRSIVIDLSDQGI